MFTRGCKKKVKKTEKKESVRDSPVPFKTHNNNDTTIIIVNRKIRYVRDRLAWTVGFHDFPVSAALARTIKNNAGVPVDGVLGVRSVSLEIDGNRHGVENIFDRRLVRRRRREVALHEHRLGQGRPCAVRRPSAAVSVIVQQRAQCLEVFTVAAENGKEGRVSLRRQSVTRVSTGVAYSGGSCSGRFRILTLTATNAI